MTLEQCSKCFYKHSDWIMGAVLLSCSKKSKLGFGDWVYVEEYKNCRHFKETDRWRKIIEEEKGGLKNVKMGRSTR